MGSVRIDASSISPFVSLLRVELGFHPLQQDFLCALRLFINEIILMSCTYAATSLSRRGLVCLLVVSYSRATRFRSLATGTKRHHLSLEDVAEVAVRAVGSQQKKLEVPISAEALSYREVIALAAELTGKSIHIEALEPDQRIENVPAQIRDILTELMTGLALGPEMNLTTPEVAEKLGIRFTTVRDYLKQALVEPTSAGHVNTTGAQA